MNAILCCVDMSDILSITLPYNRRHFDQVVIVTTPQDHNTQEVAVKNNATPFATESFYADGGLFRKYLALEEGLDFMGRKGWLCIMDVDVLWPKKIPVRANSHKGEIAGSGWVEEFCEPGYLYSPLRRMMIDITKPIPDEGRWREFPLHPQTVEWAGYSQIFHAQDAVLGNPPWHDTTWLHCGGGDSFFQGKWARERKIRPAWEVLHLGEAGINWLGRTERYRDGSTPAGAEERKRALRGLLARRRENRIDPYRHERL